MKLLVIIFASVCLAALLQRTMADASPWCHSMQLVMDQYCHARDQSSGNHQLVVERRRGKAGPRGPPGKVNYTLVDENMKQRYREFEVKMENETERKQELRNIQLESKLKELEIKWEKNKNETERSLKLHTKELESRLKKLEIKWEKRENETDKRHELRNIQFESLNPFITGCDKVTESIALSWNGTGGIFNIYPDNPQQSIEVYCDLTSDGGGWTVFQRRMDGSVDFYRGWNEYVNGFGEKDKEFWLGLETIHQLTKNGNYELRVDIGDWEGERRYAQYGSFSISGSNDNYRLTVGDYSGTAGDSLIKRHNGRQFSTKDRDNDGWGSGNCAVPHTGAWWYNACHYSNLNGVYHVGGTGASDKNIAWFHWRNTHKYSYKFTEIKFRKKQN